MQSNFLQAALDYADRGYSVIPINPAIDPVKKRPLKKPFIFWEEFQKRRATAEEIQAWWGKYPGAMIGIVTGEISGIFVVDCDSQEGFDAVQDLLPDSLLIPMARTPRGGWHLFFRWLQDYKLTIGAGVLPGVDFRGEGGYIIAAPSKNAEGKSYSWQEGLSLDDIELPSMPSALQGALSINNKSTYCRGGVDSSVDSAEFFTEGRRDNDLFHTANCLVKGGMPAGEISQVLEKLIISWGESPDQKWIDAKVQSAMARAGRRDRTLSVDVREWVLSTSGVFLSTEIYSCLQLSTREERKNVSIILKRLSEEGVIEKYGNKNGQYRCLDDELEALDWKNADTKPLNLQWPFGIEHLVSMYPGNIAVIAGSPNAGKTSFILNFIRLNQKSFKVHLFSSEGGKEELKQRLSKFDLPLEDWTFSAWDRTGNFQDVIKPDSINIVDYLEIHDEFYKVGGILKGISDRLKSGFCLIALQKNSGRDEGLGGARGLEKPRLYLAMDNGKLKIVKGKSWADRGNNPNGKAVRFKLVDGCKFIIESKWEKDQ